jgi:DNA-directed RNA polymerase specialized sigma24 family protein
MSEGEGGTPDPRGVLAKDRTQNGSFIAKNLLGYLFKRTRDPDAAADAAQEAIARVLAGEGWHRWVYDGEQTVELSLLNHLCDLGRDVIKKDRKRAARRHETEEDPVRDAATADPEPRADDQIEAVEEDENERRLAALVWDRLDERTRDVLVLAQEGIDDAAEIARRLGCTPRDVYRARERVAYHRDAVLDEERAKGGRS